MNEPNRPTVSNPVSGFHVPPPFPSYGMAPPYSAQPQGAYQAYGTMPAYSAQTSIPYSPHPSQPQIPHPADQPVFYSPPATYYYPVPFMRIEPEPGAARASKVCGILSICTFFWCLPGMILGVIAVVLGARARRAGNNSGAVTSGIVCGIIGLSLAALMLISLTAMSYAFFQFLLLFMRM